MDDPNAEQTRLTLQRINRARMAQGFLEQAITALQNSGLASWPEGELNITDRILASMRETKSDLDSMIDYAEQHRKT